MADGWIMGIVGAIAAGAVVAGGSSVVQLRSVADQQAKFSERYEVLIERVFDMHATVARLDERTKACK